VRALALFKRHWAILTIFLAAVAAGVGIAHWQIARGGSAADNTNGWRVSFNLGRFADDPLLRARIAHSGLGALPREEALYYTLTRDAMGRRLRGDKRYVLRFAPGQLPPVAGFWSLTVYDAKTGMLVDNPIGRYAISDRTDGLIYEDDGSLAIAIERNEPAAGGFNWLPAPRSGRFVLVLRAYEPGPEMQNGRWRPPIILRVTR